MGDIARMFIKTHGDADGDVDGPVYDAGRSEGHADVAARLRAILDPEDVNKWTLDGLLNKVDRDARMLEALRRELNDLCGWGDESIVHAYTHIGNIIKNLRADAATERYLRENMVPSENWSYCPYCGVEAPRPGNHKPGCPAHGKGGSR